MGHIIHKTLCIFFSLALSACTGKIFGQSSIPLLASNGGTPQVLSAYLPSNGTYGSSQELVFALHFSQNVMVSGIPSLQLRVGSSLIPAPYFMGSGSGLLFFHYYPQFGDQDLDGIEILPQISSIAGSITSLEGAAASLNFSAPSSLGILIQSLQPTVMVSAPSASSVLMTSGSVDFGITYLGASNFHLNASLVNLVTANGASCTVTVLNGTTATPTVHVANCSPVGADFKIGILAGAAEDASAHLTVASPQSSSVSVSGSSALAFNPLVFNFGNQVKGTTSAAQIFTLSNSGTGDASACQAPSLIGANPGDFSIVSDTCGTSNLIAGASCTVGVSASPLNTGTRTATLSRICSVGGSVATTANGLQLNGQSPVLAWSPLSKAFGSMPAGRPTLATDFTLTNSGDAAASGCQAPQLSGTNASSFEIYLDNCGTSPLAISSSCVVKVRARASGSGSFTGTLTRNCTVGGSVNTTSDALTVNGTQTLSWAHVHSDVGYASPGKVTAPYLFRFHNESKLTASGCTAATITDGTNFEIVNDGCGTSDALPLSSCTVAVRGKPSASGHYETHLTRTCSGQSADMLIGGDGAGDYVTQISSGSQHSCLLTNYGQVHCYGNNVYGQIGNGGQADWARNSYVLSSTSQVSAGAYFNCALQQDQTVKCWGANDWGQIGSGSTGYSQYITTVSGLSSATSISSGREFACAITSPSGQIRCWGRNDAGQFGNGTTTSTSNAVNGPALTGFTQVSAASDHTCGLLSDGTVRCWGSNFAGQLGNGTTNGSAIPIDPGLTNVTQINTGQYSSCAVLSGGTLKCWGINEQGQLSGSGNFLSPTTVAGISNVTQVSLSSGVREGGHLCALLSSGTVKCLGQNYFGQLGDPASTAPSNTPISVAGLSSVQSISSGNQHTCALTSAKEILCWGNNGTNQFGTNNAYVYEPAQIQTVSSAVQVVGGESFSCALISDGTVKCWGDNFSGQLGDGTQIPRAIPITVPSVNNAVQLEATIRGVCAKLMNSSVVCWGGNGNGALGLGNSSDQYSAVAASLWGNIASLQSSTDICAVYADHTAKCVGDNYQGTLGDGTTSSTNSPVSVSVVSNIDQIAGGYMFSCVKKLDGTVACYGLNGGGQLGDGSTTSRATAATVPGLSSVADMVALSDNACARLNDGKIKCWGFGGRNGNGNGSNQLLADYVSSSDPAIALAATQYVTCALHSDQTVSCFGTNIDGDLGDGTRDGADYPTPVYGLSQVSSLMSHSVTLGRHHQCAVKTDGTVWCWGDDQYHQSSGKLDVLSHASGY